MLLWLANIFSTLSPQTRLFGLRRRFFQLGGVNVAPTAKICGTARIASKNVSIGEGTWLGAGAEIAAAYKSPVTIGARCDIAPGVMFVTGSHEMGDAERRAGEGTSAPIIIGDGTWIGTRATFIAGAAVGAGSMVDAGSLVRGEFPPNSLIAGVPARVIRSFEDDTAQKPVQ